MRSINRLVMAATALVVASAGAAAPAYAQDEPSMEVHYGDAATGPTHQDFTVPEYPEVKQSGPFIVVTVVNTGKVPLTVQLPTGSGCRNGGKVAPGESIVCGWWIGPARGRPGTTSPMNLDVVAVTDTGTKVTRLLTGTYRFYDVVPRLRMELTAMPNRIAAPGKEVYFIIERTTFGPWWPYPRTVALTSSHYGNLLDPNNPKVTNNSCPISAQERFCEFTAKVEATPGTTTEETIALTITDETGPLGSETASVTVSVDGHDVDAWAAPEAVWPAVAIDHVQVRRRTWTTDIFDMPGRCERVVPARLGTLVKTPPPAKGACRQQWRLARAATVALLNEAALGDKFPAANATAVRDETVETLTWGNARAASRLAEKYEGWNRG